MSLPLGELSHDQHYPPQDNFEQYYDTYSSLAVPSSDYYYTSENLYLWQDMDGIYHWADASSRSDGSMAYPYPSYYPSAYASEVIQSSDYSGHRHGDLEECSQSAATQDNSYTFHSAQQFRNGSGRVQTQDHWPNVTRASDSFIAQGASIFSDGYTSSRRGSTLDYQPSIPHQSNPQRDPRPPSRKRSREALDEAGSSYPVKEEDNTHSSSLSTANACRLPKPPMVVPSQTLPSATVRIPHPNDATTSLKVESQHEPRLRPEERCAIPAQKPTSNKRVHRSGEELVRQESAVLIPTTWPIPDDQVIKGTKKPGEQKKQALACLFCRERKIACGRPPAHSPDQTCNQCLRRRIKCEYPTESRRGQHKRRRKPVDGEPAGQSTVRTNSMSNVPSTASPASSTTITTSTPSA